MQSLSKIIKALALALLVSACATGAAHIPEKYALDNQLEQVKEIQDFRLLGRMRPGFPDFEEPGENPLEVMDRRDTTVLTQSSHQWTAVDQQSFILRTGPKDYYLLVLQIPAPEIMYSEDISIYCMNNTIRVGADYVQFPEHNSNLRYGIERIYKINGLPEMRAILDQLRSIP